MREELSSYRRFASAVQAFLRERMTPEQARERLREQLQRREHSLLDMLRRSVFHNTTNPYRRLFDYYEIGLDDVAKLVREHGVEGSLRKLREAGVFLAQEEFKGRRPICRPGLEIPTTAEDFDNPNITFDYEVTTSGSSGKASVMRYTLGLMRHEAAYVSCYLDSFNLRQRPIACWRGVPPVSSGVNLVLRYGLLGLRVEKWFAQNELPDEPEMLRYRVAIAALVRGGKRAGWALPTPDFVHQDDAARIARWLAECVRRGTPAHLDTNASSGVRICIAAQDEGIDISGTFFRFGGEPLTSAKDDVVRASNCKAVCHYSTCETSHLGVACANGDGFDDVHVLLDKLAIIDAPKAIGPAGQTVPALMVTTILPTCPKILINVENGDYGTLRRRACGCALGELGFDLHLSNIRSYDKFTSEGMNYLACDLLKLIEEVLPRRFGGRPSDYQFVEREDRGMPKVTLVASPRLGEISERDALDAVYGVIRAVPGGKLMSDFWEEARTVELVRREPYAGGSAKIQPLLAAKKSS